MRAPAPNATVMFHLDTHRLPSSVRRSFDRKHSAGSMLVARSIDKLGRQQNLGSIMSDLQIPAAMAGSEVSRSRDDYSLSMEHAVGVDHLPKRGFLDHEAPS